MKIRQMILVDESATMDHDNCLAFIIYKNDGLTRWSMVTRSVTHKIFDTYYRAFNFKEIYVTKTPREN